MLNKDENPWLKISACDYEGHMSSANVQQLSALSSIFAKVFNELNPKSILFLGCTTGNGFEHLNPDVEIVGVDINRDYLDICKAIFSEKLSNLKLICADLNSLEEVGKEFDLVYAALVFEYVDVNRLLNKIHEWTKPGKDFVVVLQQESKSSAAISETKYDSVKLLEPIHKLVDHESFREACFKIGFIEIKSEEICLPGEKRLSIITFRK